MGFQDRYYGGDNWKPRQYGAKTSRRGGGVGDWEAWKLLIAANVIVFLLQVLVTRPATLDELSRSPYLGQDYYPGMFEPEEMDSDVEDLNRGDDPKDAQAEDNETSANSQEPSSNDEYFLDEISDDLICQVEEDSDGLTANQLEDDTEATALQEKETNSEIDGDELDEEVDFEELKRQINQTMNGYRPRVSVIQKWFELDAEKVKRGQIWRLVTCGFCHDRNLFWHILINMLFLFWFGKRLEMVFGYSEFLAFYFSALVVASLAYIALEIYTQSNVPAIGASGAVWGVAALYALMYPYERIYIYFLFPVEIRWLVLIYFLFDLLPILRTLGGEQVFSGVAHAAHVGGAIFGFAYWKQSWRLMPLIDRVQRRFSNLFIRSTENERDARVFKMPSRDEMESASNVDQEELDQLLEKISRSGHSSLSDEELQRLEETSKRIRERRGS